MSRYYKVFNFDDASLENFTFHLNNNTFLQEINILIDSSGGVTSCLYGMIDYLNFRKLPITTFCLGRALSCGAILLAAGTKGRRYISSNSSVMVHGTQVTVPNNGVQYALDHIRSMALNDKIHNQQFLSLLDKFAGKKKGYFKKKIASVGDGNVWYTAKEAVEEGLADYVGFPPKFEEWDNRFSY